MALVWLAQQLHGEEILVVKLSVKIHFFSLKAKKICYNVFRDYGGIYGKEEEKKRRRNGK